MKNFLEVCQYMKGELGRELQKREKDFLRWVDENHQKELRGLADEYCPNPVNQDGKVTNKSRSYI